MKLGMEFGFLAPKLTVQLRKQGLRLKRGKRSYERTWGDLNLAISSLALAGIITEGAKDAARKKLLRHSLKFIDLDQKAETEEGNRG